MENIINICQVGLDSAALALCCIGIFSTKEVAKVRNFLSVPILFLFCMVARVNLIVGVEKTNFLPTTGFEIAPANNIFVLLFLLLAVLLLNSIFWNIKDSKVIFGGTMIVFSLYFLVRYISVAVLLLCGATGYVFLIGSRILSLGVLWLLLITPVFTWLRQIARRESFINQLVSTNIVILFMGTLVTLSFDINQFAQHLLAFAVALLLLFLLDSVLLYFDQRRIQERKRVHMIEQYVPIVEELISQVRARQHEFNNRMIAIEAAVDSADTLEEAKSNVAMLTSGLSINPNDRELLSCDSKIIAGMLFEKMKQAEAAGISMEIELHGLFKKSKVLETEWIEIIGILLDNAIEASSKGNIIFVRSRAQGHALEFSVCNPAAAMSNTEFMALFQKGTTTKGDRLQHGFGLYNILRLVEHHHGKIITKNEQRLSQNHVVFGVLLP